MRGQKGQRCGWGQMKGSDPVKKKGVATDEACAITPVNWLLTHKCGEMKSLSRVQLFATPWTVACQTSPFMGFSRQKYWSGLPYPSPGDPPNPEIKPGSPALQADSLLIEPPGNPYFIN